MKSILISIKPKWVAKILNGEKTIEVRKSKPKCDLPIDVYIYCTKDKPYLHYGYNKYGREVLCHNEKTFGSSPVLNGKVIAKFTLNKVEEIYFENHKSIYCDDPLYPETDSLSYDELLDKSCTKALPYGETEIGNYIGEKGYAWHISNLVIFDRPKELYEFCGTKQYFIGCESGTDKTPRYARLTKAPQSYQFIEVGE